MQTDDEILRLRQRCHDLEASARGFELRIDRAGDRITHLEQLANKYVPLVDSMIDNDKIADALAARLAERNTLAFSRRQWAVGVVVAVIALLPAWLPVFGVSVG